MTRGRSRSPEKLSSENRGRSRSPVGNNKEKREEVKERKRKNRWGKPEEKLEGMHIILNHYSSFC